MALWNRFLNRVRLARGLAFFDWLVLIEAWWGLGFYYVALRWISLERLSRGSFSALKETRKNLAAARRLHRLMGLAARLHILPMACLVQSLALRRLLQRRGLASSLMIGAARDSGSVRAHAWLEMDGEKIGETEDVDGIFRVLTRGTSP